MGIFGIVGDGITNVGSQLRAAITANQSGELTLPAGIYLIDTIAHPRDGTKQVGLVLPANFRLRGAGPGVTIIRFLKNVPNQAFMALNQNFDGVVANDENISIEDIQFDGNATNQPSTSDANYGPSVYRGRRITFINCVFKNVLGTTATGNGVNGTNGVGYCVETQFCTDVQFTDCRCLNDSGNASNGFQVDQGCTMAVFINCLANGMTKGSGFAVFNSGQIEFSNCSAWLNANHGFDIENSQDILLRGCVAGATAGPTAGFPYTINQSLGNTVNGVNLVSDTRVYLVACSACNNTQHGISVTGAGSALTRIVGGRIQNNGGWGLNTDTNPTNLLVDADPTFGTNTSGDIKKVTGQNAATPHGIQANPPAIAATTVAVPNPFPFPCMVFVTGGTVTVIAVDTQQMAGATPAWVLVPAWSSITLTYSAAPTWIWVGATQ